MPEKASFPEININNLLNDGRHFSRKNSIGALEIVDSITGNLIAILADPLKPQPLVKRILPNGDEAWVEQHLADHVVQAAGRGLMAYAPWIVDVICEKIASGGALTRICDEPGMPSYSVFCRWRRKHPHITEQLEEARRDRAEFHRDQAVEEARKADGDNPIEGPRLRIETHKWAAGVDDARFSPRAKVEATISAPTQIIVHTGIDRTSPGVDAKDVTPKISEDKNVTSTIHPVSGADDGSIGGHAPAVVSNIVESFAMPDPS